MKQSALVIATLFASVEATQSEARARLERDIRGYLNNGVAFDTRVINAVHGNARREARINAHFKDEVRENWAEGHVVMDEYVNAMKYEKSQEVYTPPSAANGQWGNIHYNNPQKIMDNYVEAMENEEELGEEWREDIHDYAKAMKKSHKIMGKQIKKAANTNGRAAAQYAQNIGEDIQQISAPQQLAIDSVEVREDTENFLNNVGAASEAVRKTMRISEEANKVPDRQIDRANWQYIKAREQIARGYNKAIAYEIANTHFDAGVKGGEGKLDWTNKQGIVNRWKRPIEHNERATAAWQAKVGRAVEEKQAIKQAVQQQAQRTWPKRFQAVEQSWNELAANFEQPQSLVSTEVIRSELRDTAETNAALWESVVDDVIQFNNSTVDQRRQFKSDVKTYIEQKEAINQQYANAWNYEMDNIHFKKSPTGQISYTVDNREVILDKWTNAMTEDVEAREELKADFIRYQKSIAAEKAAFKATAQAQWPKKFEAYKAAVVKFDQTMNGPQERAAVTPQSLITDQQSEKFEEIRAQVYENINEREAFKWEVKKDLKAYLENTNGARDQLKQEAAEWKQGSKQVQDMYAAAWNYQVSQTKYTPATAQAPAHIELENPQQVQENFRAAAQADEDLGQKIVGDVQNFKNATAPARANLKNEINNQWIPDMEQLQRSDVQIIEEIIGYNRTHSVPYQVAGHVRDNMNETSGFRTPNVTYPQPATPPSLLSVDGSSSLSASEKIAYGSCFLGAMVAIAALSNSGKKSKTVEFDVEDLEMTNKTSKKQIKKTLKDIMKTSNTKVTLMNN